MISIKNYEISIVQKQLGEASDYNNGFSAGSNVK